MFLKNLTFFCIVSLSLAGCGTQAIKSEPTAIQSGSDTVTSSTGLYGQKLTPQITNQETSVRAATAHKGLFGTSLFSGSKAANNTPYNAAKARYDRLMSTRTSISRHTVKCLPMWCKKMSNTSSNTSVETAQRVAKKIEANHKQMLSSRNNSADTARQERSKQEREARLEEFKAKKSEEKAKFQEEKNNILP